MTSAYYWQGWGVEVRWGAEMGKRKRGRRPQLLRQRDRVVDFNYGFPSGVCRILFRDRRRRR